MAELLKNDDGLPNCAQKCSMEIVGCETFFFQGRVEGCLSIPGGGKGLSSVKGSVLDGLGKFRK